MKIDNVKHHSLSVEHEQYVARITPIIRAQLASRGRTEAQIDRFISEIPTEHILTRLMRALTV